MNIDTDKYYRHSILLVIIGFFATYILPITRIFLLPSADLRGRNGQLYRASTSLPPKSA